MTATDATNYITSLSDSYGNESTDYDAALATAITAFKFSGKIEGGTLSVTFVMGAYSYAAPANVTEDTPEVFSYTIQDADLDRSFGDLEIERNFKVGLALGHQFGNLMLREGQTGHKG